MNGYEYRHLVGFEETNLVGNVYYVNHLRWQGRCRELFLRQHFPEVVEQIEHGLVIFTMRCSCHYLSELRAFDEVILRMQLGDIQQNRLEMRFDYWRRENEGETRIARGEQEVVFMRREGTRLVETSIPRSIRDAARRYSITNPAAGEAVSRG